MDNNGELHGALALLGFSIKIKDDGQKNECITEAIGVIKKYIEKPRPEPAPPSDDDEASSLSSEEEDDDVEMHLSSDSVSSEEPHTPPRNANDEVNDEEEEEEDDFVVDDEEPIKEFDKETWDTIMKKYNEKHQARKRARPKVLRFDEEDFPGDSDDKGEDCGGSEVVTKDMRLGMGAAYEIFKFNTYSDLEKDAFWKKHFGDAMSSVESNCGAQGKPNEHARMTISEYIRGPTLEGKNVEIVSLHGRRRAKCCLCGATQMCEEQIKPGDLPVATVCRHLAAALIEFYQVLYKGNPDYGQLFVNLRRAMDKVTKASANKRDKRKVKRGRRKY
jgi:hypothetical protein